MRVFSIAVMATLFFTSSVLADSCELNLVRAERLPFKSADGLPVMVGRYQFQLPGKLDALLAVDGVMAVYPGKNYISYQLISDEVLAGTLSRFSTGKLSAMAFERYLYGVDPLLELNDEDQAIIRKMRSDLSLDCHARLLLLTVGSFADVVFQEATQRDVEHRILFFDNETANLISVKGSKEVAMSVLQSIKKREFKNGVE